MNSDEKRGQFFRFALEGADSASGEQTALFGEFQPKERFVSFLQNASNFINPICFAAGAAGRTVTGGDGCRRTKNLSGYNFALLIMRQSVSHCHYAKRKSLCPSCFNLPLGDREKAFPNPLQHKQQIHQTMSKTVCSLCQHEIPAEYLMKHREEETREIVE